MRPSFALRAILLALLVLVFGAQTALAACCTCDLITNPSTKTCINTTSPGACSNLTTSSQNPNIKAQLTNCTDDPVCKGISQQGTCQVGPVEEVSYGVTAQTQPPATPAGTGKTVPIIVPDLNIKIPGLVFSNVAVEEGGYVAIPIFAQYVAAVYKFLVIISAIAAAIMIVYGGFLYIVAASGANIKRGKSIIVDAVIGLILVFGVYIILNTINPELLKLDAIKISLVKPDPYNSYLGAGPDAKDNLAFVGITPGPGGITGEAGVDTDAEYAPPASTAAFPTNLTVPRSCPGRDPSFEAGKPLKGGYNFGYPASALAIPLDEETIRAYLKEQARTGVPMGVIIAQIMSETGSNKTSKCIVQNLFKDPSVCGKADYIKYFNFGGVGCTGTRVPAGVCPHTAFSPGFDPNNSSKKYGEAGCDAPDGPNATFNKYNSACVQTCRDYGSAQALAATIDCGETCYPQISHAAAPVNGTMVWYPSVQCSRKYKNAQEFLDDHLGFARFCLPYNDSVYKFAYCIGASGYGGAGLKPAFLSEVIDRNCLCGSKDSTGCKRDFTLEKNLANHIWQEATLVKYAHTCTKFDSNKKCIDPDYFKSGPDYNAIIKALKEATHGSLDAHEFPGTEGVVQVGP